jgi:hypothetical protein
MSLVKQIFIPIIVMILLAPLYAGMVYSLITQLNAEGSSIVGSAGGVTPGVLWPAILYLIVGFMAAYVCYLKGMIAALVSILVTASCGAFFIYAIIGSLLWF